jgi:beta-phosphoglucomutase-like phosphatase (HAD superfamily)
LALQRMNAAEPVPSPLIRATERLVFEDSRAGIRSAHVAGMKIVALKTTSSADQRLDADWVLGNFRRMSLERLEWLVG